MLFPEIKKYALLFVCVMISFTLVNCENSDTKSIPDSGRVLEFPDSLRFKDIAGNEISILRYASAKTVKERNQGLMDVRKMPQDAGMVFFFDKEEKQSFWMANTPLSLDIFYVNADFKIVNIYPSTTPFSKTSLPSEFPAKYVVETNAGYAINYDIQPGDYIELID